MSREDIAPVVALTILFFFIVFMFWMGISTSFSQSDINSKCLVAGYNSYALNVGGEYYCFRIEGNNGVMINSKVVGK